MAQCLDDSKQCIDCESEIQLTADQQQTLIAFWDDAVSLYKHAKEKLIYTTNLCRYNKLQQQMDECNEEDCKYNITKDRDEHINNEHVQMMEWNYLIICIRQLLKLNNENVS